MSTRVRDLVLPVTLAAVLTWYNNVAGRSRLHRRWYLALNAGATAAVLALAVADGLSLDDLGLRPGRARDGLRAGAVIGIPVTAAYAVAIAVPPARAPLRDRRVAGLTGRQIAYQALVRIPVGTVLWEETAFRGALHAALSRVLPRPAAIAAGGAVFGLWHIRPAAETLAVNGLAAGPAARARAVAGVAAGTAAAGVLLSVLRDRSGSLAAPVAAHLAATCPGPVASALATALAARRQRSWEIITVQRELQMMRGGCPWNSGCTSRTSPGTAGPPSSGHGWLSTRRTPRTRGSRGSR